MKNMTNNEVALRDNDLVSKLQKLEEENKLLKVCMKKKEEQYGEDMSEMKNKMELLFDSLKNNDK